MQMSRKALMILKRISHWIIARNKVMDIFRINWLYGDQWSFQTQTNRGIIP